MGLGSGIRIKPIPDPGPGVKKAPDPGSGTLLFKTLYDPYGAVPRYSTVRTIPSLFH
jgi:hypothetical protein